MSARHNPYVGPVAFVRGQQLYGRDREVMDLLDLLIAERIVLFYSPSGAGKTSLINASLAPELEKEGFQVLPTMRVGLEPALEDNRDHAGNRYLISAMLSLEEGLPPGQQTPLADLMRLDFADYLAQRSGPDEEADAQILIFDQFEEILSVDPADLHAKTAFFDQVGQVLQDSRRWALFSLREEFIAGLDTYRLSIPTRLMTRYRLELLGDLAAIQAVRNPAQGASVEFTPRAARKLVDDLRTTRVQRADGQFSEVPGPYVEPLQLQVVCRRLWDRLAEGANEIGEAFIEAVGDVDTALRDYYADQIARIARETGVIERRLRDWIDQQLITPQGIRGQVLRGSESSQGLDNRAVDRLVDAHLVRAEERRGVTWIELAHDRLIEPVREENRAWQEANLNPFQRQAALWEDSGRTPGLLLVEAGPLEEAEVWAHDHPEELTALEVDFLEGSREAHAQLLRDQEQQRRIRRLAIIASVVGLIALAALLIAGLVFQSQVRTERALGTQTARRSQLEIEATAQALQDEADATAQALQAEAEATAQFIEIQALQNRAELSQYYNLSLAALGLADDRLDQALLLGLEANRLLEGQPPLDLQLNLLVDLHLNLIEILKANPRLITYLRHHPAGVWSVAISPDGRLLASGDEEGRIWLTDLASGAPLAELGDPALGRVRALAFSPDGNLLASAGTGGQIQIWDSNERSDSFGQPSGEPLFGHNGTIRTIAFSPDGELLATGGVEPRLLLWEVRSGTILFNLSGHNALVNAVDFSPDGRFLASGDDASDIYLWDLSEEEPRRSRRLGDHTSWILGLNFSPDGSLLASGSGDHNIFLWDVETLERVGPTLSGHTSWVTSVAFSPDGRLLASGGQDTLALLWDVNPNSGDFGKEVDRLRGHTDAVRAVAFSPDGRKLVSGSPDSTLLVWDVLRQQRLAFSLTGHSAPVWSVAFSPDGSLLASGSTDTTIRLWDPQAGQPIGLPWQAHNGRVPGLAFSPDGAWLASGSLDDTVLLWEVASGQPLVELPKAGTQAVMSVAFSPDGATLAAGTKGGLILRWDTDQLRALPSLQGHAFEVRSLDFSPDGRLLASGAWDRSIHVWDLESGQSLVLKEGLDLVSVVAFSPDGAFLASGSFPRTLYFWDPIQGEPIARQVTGETAIVSLSFHPDGQILATGSNDGTIIIWNAATRRPLGTLEPKAGNILSLDFSPDGRILASGTASNDVILWDLDFERWPAKACAIANRNLTGSEWSEFFGTDVPYRLTCPELPSGETE